MDLPCLQLSQPVRILTPSQWRLTFRRRTRCFISGFPEGLAIPARCEPIRSLWNEIRILLIKQEHFAIKQGSLEFVLADRRNLDSPAEPTGFLDRGSAPRLFSIRTQTYSQTMLHCRAGVAARGGHYQ